MPRGFGFKNKFYLLGCVLAAVSMAVIASAVMLRKINIEITADDRRSLFKGGEKAAERNIPSQPLEQERYNLLLCGIDHTKALADVIIYTSFDIKNKKADVIQIPRDFFIGTGYTTGKINSACLPFESQDPTRRIADIVEKQLCLPIDGCAAITLAGVRALVDAVGGVRITLDKPINYLPQKTIPAGENTLSGEQAEWLLRYRSGYQMGDLDRLKLQMRFLVSAAKAAKGLSYTEAIMIAAKNIDYIKTTIPFSEIRSLIEQGLSLQIDDINISAIPVYAAKYGEYSVLCADRYKLADFFNGNVCAANPIDPWSLKLFYPPQEAKSEQSAANEQALPQEGFDFSWEFSDEDDYNTDAEGIVIRNKKTEVN